MSSQAATRRATTRKRQARLSSVFWGLARGSGDETTGSDPVGVVRHLLASVAVLQGTSHHRDVAADALTFLLQLENDPYYASPEQIRGGDKDSQGLVYSIGVLLFERLTGHHPFVESLSPMECALSRDRGRRVGKNNLASLPKRLRDMLQQAMSPFPEDRWPDLPAFAASLQQFVDHHQTVMKPLEWRRGLGSQPELPRLTTTPNTPRSLGSAKTQVFGHAPTQPLRAAPTHVDRVAPRQTTPPLPAKAGPRGRRKSSPPPCPGSPERRRIEAISGLAEGSAPKPQPPRPATVEISPMAFVPAPAPPLAANENTGLLDINLRPRPRIGRLAVVGAAVFACTVGIATTLIGGNGSTNTASASSNAAAPAVADDDRVAVTARDEANAPSETPASDSAPVAIAPTTEPTVTRIALPPFDADVGGAAALTAIRPCYSAAQLRRGTELGVSLHYSSKSGVSDQVYFASGATIPAPQRRCLADKLRGLAAGAAPTRGTIATYTFWLSTTTERHRLHRRK